MLSRKLDRLRAMLIWVAAAVAVAVAALLGFPELFGVLGAKPAAAEGDRVAIAPPVIVATATRAPFADVMQALGTVIANESVEITPNSADHVMAIHFADGQEVEAGQLLVEMNAAEEKALLAEAMAIRDERKTNHERIRELFAGQMTSERELQNAAAVLAASQARVLSLEAEIEDRHVRAPFAGTLGLRHVSVGSYVQPSTTITTLDDLTVVKLDFTIPETWLGEVQPGMKITAHSDAWPQRLFEGEVRILDTRLDARSRSATVRAILPNPERLLRPGMLLKVTVERGEESVLQVPEESLIQVSDEHFVWRLDGQDVAQRVPVVIGRRRVGSVEIRAGIDEGDRVIRGGIMRVRPGEKVAVRAAPDGGTE